MQGVEALSFLRGKAEELRSAEAALAAEKEEGERAIQDVEVLKVLERAPAIVSRRNPFVVALRDAVALTGEGAGVAVGRDGASDAFAFLEAGIPAVEFGPSGNGHHGPEEWVSIASLARYRRALVEFVRAVPGAAAAPAPATAPGD